MKLLTTSDNQSFIERIDAYNKLSPLHETTIHILAVIYEYTARTNILNAMKKFFVGDDDFKQYKVTDLDPTLDDLCKLGLVERNEMHFCCFVPLREPICRLLAENGWFHEIADAVQRTMPVNFDEKTYDFPSYDQTFREIRISIYRRDFDGVHELMDYYERHYATHNKPQDHPFVLIFTSSFDSKWTREYLPVQLQLEIAQELTGYFQRCGLSPNSELLNFLKDVSSLSETKEGEHIRGYLAEQLILNGRLIEAETVVAGDDGMSAFLVRGFSAFLRGNNTDAVEFYETALKILKKSTRKRKIYFTSVSGIFFLLALVKEGAKQQVQAAKTYAAIAAKDNEHPQHRAFIALGELIASRQGDPDALETLRQWYVIVFHEDPVSSLIQCLAIYWMDRRKGSGLIESLTFLQGIATNNDGHGWVRAEVSIFLARLDVKVREEAEKATAFFDRSGIRSIIDLIRPESRWQQALSALINLNREDADVTDDARPLRLVWFFDMHETHGFWDLSPRLQVRTASGAWSKGRKIALKRLYHEIHTFDFLTLQDEKVCAGIEENHRIWRGYPEVSYHFTGKALTSLAGHPLVFSEKDPRTRMEIVTGTPELTVNRDKGGKFKIAFINDFHTDTGEDVQLIKKSSTRVKVIETGEEVRRIAKIIGPGLKVPAAGKKQLLEAVERVSSIVTVHSQLDGIGQTAQEAPADPTPNVHLRRLGDGLKLGVWVQPFAPGGPCFRPGEGGETLICDIAGKLQCTRRDLQLERQLAGIAVTGCPTLVSGELDAGMWEWTLNTLEACFETLMELNALEPSVALKWPEGEPFTLRRQTEMKHFFIRVEKSRDWFSVSGELKVDNDLVLSMERLLDLLENAKGRFVQLEDGQFLALTWAFKRRLEELAAYSKKSGKHRHFHPLAALFLEDMAGEVGGFYRDKHWKAHIGRFEDALSLKPEVPSTLMVDLRGYQVEGFVWLARLCHWGVGACLADDMGLGKTLQALTVMLTRAARGPSLVVAPTSVGMNWEAEVGRFAPSLNVVGLSNGDRGRIVADLNPFDLLVVSYGLLQQEKVAKMLAAVHFEIIVLDEAQAIKNHTTKRSQAAMKLDGGFKLITTGTPIENHLGELWTLFTFINPGLLGSLKTFTDTFATPIEKNRDRTARKRLKKLVQPFILRRTKSQVLEELPPRTDILIQVELSAEERAFYEALRRNALETLTGDGASGQGAHLKILAEIMKLRRACCHPSLVLPEASLPSAKLGAFGDIVDDLLVGGHKALVFSQFTGHLNIIRDYVEKRSIRYQYLDGSTSQKARKRSVVAFQDGDGDLFLISLKAGGVGLNLTAADYVIHMDPWWNPAVEDQAADRVHRIGQTRPVTVYSLIASHTIEEKIVALHRSKRDLADSLLDGADLSGKMTADELLGLIRDE